MFVRVCAACSGFVVLSVRSVNRNSERKTDVWKSDGIVFASSLFFSFPPAFNSLLACSFSSLFLLFCLLTHYSCFATYLLCDIFAAIRVLIFPSWWTRLVLARSVFMRTHTHSCLQFGSAGAETLAGWDHNSGKTGGKLMWDWDIYSSQLWVHRKHRSRCICPNNQRGRLGI